MEIKKFAIILIILSGAALTAFTGGIKSTAEVDGRLSTAPENNRPIVVLELFTSQGCSSCPPADALLDAVKRENESTVFALSYHVDYWNYIGWKDPFSNAKHTERQRKYNIKLKSRSNYTPQLVVNGKEHFVGSDASKVAGAIRKYKSATPENLISLANVKGDSHTVSFDFTMEGNVTGKNLRAVLVLDKRETNVNRGENKNRNLTNSNVVVAVKPISITGSEGKSFMAIPEIVAPGEKISLILLAENDIMDITGAAKALVDR